MKFFWKDRSKFLVTSRGRVKRDSMIAFLAYTSRWPNSSGSSSAACGRARRRVSTVSGHPGPFDGVQGARDGVTVTYSKINSTGVTLGWVTFYRVGQRSLNPFDMESR
jgi:hypothetical protein